VVVTEGVYLLDGYRLSFFQINSPIDAGLVRGYCRVVFFLKYI